jgi:ribosomal protein S18 acetylase RimI-like enzyme
MDSIIRLNKRHVLHLAEIDYASEHQGDRAQNISLAEMKQEITARFRQGHELFFGLKRDHELIGYVTLKPFFPGHKHCEVYWLAVKKQWQGRGLGRTLMTFIEAFAKKRGFRKVFVYTGKDMKRTRGFYEKIGYQCVNEFPGYYGYSSGNTTAVLYAKNIS